MTLKVRDKTDVCPMVWTMESSFFEFSNLEGHMKNDISKRLIWKKSEDGLIRSRNLRF